MRATLIYKPHPGGQEQPQDVVAALKRTGYDRVDVPRYDRAQMVNQLAEPGDLVVAAGGDGTVGAALMALAGRGVPLAILPRGHANNIARTLGAPRELDAWGAGLARPRRVAMDVGTFVGAGGPGRFVESVGVGLFHHVLAVRATEAHKKKPTALELVRDTLETYAPSTWRVTVDGQDRSGSYLFVEAMNIRYLGPNVQLAPRAAVDDGALDVVFAGLAERDALRAYLARLGAGEREVAPPALPTVRARRVRIELGGHRARVDDDERPQHTPDPGERVEVSLEPGAVTVLLPA
jgi:diacylglycerol kinase (ATP)